MYLRVGVQGAFPVEEKPDRALYRRMDFEVSDCVGNSKVFKESLAGKGRHENRVV